MTFKIQLLLSSEKLSLKSTFFKDLGPIEEIKNSDSYFYMVGNSTDFIQITNLLKTAKVNFPDANLVAYKNGKKVKLKKVIRNLEK